MDSKVGWRYLDGLVDCYYSNFPFLWRKLRSTVIWKTRPNPASSCQTLHAGIIVDSLHLRHMLQDP